MPEFANQWYDSTEGNPTFNSCYIPQFNYHFKAISKDSLIEEFAANLPQHDSCRWLNQPPITIPQMVPDDFPTSNGDYYEVSKPNDAPKVEMWNFYCQDNNNQIIDSAVLFTKPTYRCPRNTAIKNSEYGRFCSTEPGVCMADVVGRNLDYPGLGWLGHTGLIKSNQTDQTAFVLEVLNERPVIQLNPLTTFKTRSPYWGAVYGLESLEMIEANKATSAFQAGVNQIQFDPEYTLTAQWREGRYTLRPVYDESQHRLILERGIIRGMFRCDTFVNFCYLKGFDVHIVNPPTPILPRSTFHEFLFHRPNSTTLKQKTDISQEYNSLEIELTAYLGDTTIPRSLKLNNLWQRAQNSNQQHFSIITDLLSIYGAHELIPSFIYEFYQETNVQKKQKLISAITYSALSHAFEAANHPDILAVKDIVSAHLFITNQLSQEQDPALLSHSITNALTILPMSPNTYELICQAIERLHALSDKQYSFSEDQYLFIVLSMTFANNDMQVWLLPQLLGGAHTNRTKELLNKQLAFMMKQLSPSDINSSVRGLLWEYISSSIPFLSNEDKNAVFKIIGESSTPSI